MSTPQAFGPPPLPPGWTEHMGPGGQTYYHNIQTNESTYVRPLPSFLNLPQAPQPTTKKKEKPLVKTPIPNTEWIRVVTTAGNTFYTHKAKKESVWTVPEEIREALEQLDKDQAEKKEREGRELEEREKLQEQERLVEVERIKLEVQDVVKRKAEDAPIDEVVISKKARVEDDEDEDEDSGEESEEEEWQRDAAAQLAREAEEEKRRVKEEEKRAKEEAEQEAQKAKEAPQLNMPERVELSIEEAKALFKTLLREKDINPLHPWDTALPLFISDPRYVLLPSVSARRDAFDEYCRDRARELRQSNVKKEKDLANPKESFERLMKEEVKSTRISWTDFRRTWKKDRRFWGWGRDDREREKKFREYLKELGEKKRAAAQKAEADFFNLLRENGLSQSDLLWKDVKRRIASDPRYDAVGSSSLREELFSTFLKAQGPNALIPSTSMIQDDAVQEKEEVLDEAEQARRRQERKERAVKEREERVKMERGRVEADIGRSRQGLDNEEGEREFRTLLTDAIRDPKSTWEEVLPQLKTDPRLSRSPLPMNQQLHLFHSHIAQLRSKHLQNLHTLFLSHSPTLATPLSTLPIQSLLSSLPSTKLGFDIDQLHQQYEKWQRERTHEARQAFDEMLSENAFVEFWGRLGKIGGEGVEGGVSGGVATDDLGEEEAGEDVQRVDMKTLAKNVDLKEMERVLKNDRRYLMFDHIPEQRERWLRDYLAQLSAPKLSVHVKDQGT